ncbi:hypothetical protein SPHINGOR109_40063 [Sphingorhabdus sp. 109]|nr:hypothetical protein SPHINGOR109_40063 [Sphingorhabdus sp. 109]
MGRCHHPSLVPMKSPAAQSAIAANVAMPVMTSLIIFHSFFAWRRKTINHSDRWANQAAGAGSPQPRGIDGPIA